MKPSKPYIAIILLLILSTLTGCSLSDQLSTEETRENLQTVEAAVESTLQAMEDPSPPIQPPTLLPDALNGFSSYRLDVDVDWTRDVPLAYEGSSQGYILQQVTTRQPDARQVYQLSSPGIEDWWVEASGNVWNCYDSESRVCTKWNTAGYPLNHPLVAGIEAILLGAPQVIQATHHAQPVIAVQGGAVLLLQVAIEGQRLAEVIALHQALRHPPQLPGVMDPARGAELAREASQPFQGSIALRQPGITQP